MGHPERQRRKIEGEGAGYLEPSAILKSVALGVRVLC
jgi:hypothetical protein